MQSFKQQMVDNPKFPKLSDRMKLLKETQGGASAVCTVMERYEKIAAEKAAKEAEEKTRLSFIQQLLKKCPASIFPALRCPHLQRQCSQIWTLCRKFPGNRRHRGMCLRRTPLLWQPIRKTKPSGSAPLSVR